MTVVMSFLRIAVKLPILLLSESGRFRLKVLFYRFIGLQKTKILGKDFFVYKRPDGTKFIYLKNNSFCNTIYGCPNFELQELRLVCGLLSRGGTFIDGGANIGLFSTYIALRCPDVSVLAVESYPQTYMNLTRFVQELKLTSRIQCILAALSDREGEWVENVCPTGLEECNRIRRISTKANDSVPTVTLAKLMHQSSGYTVIKLDIEGHELEALHGLDSYLVQKPDRLPLILVEISKDSDHDQLGTWFEKIGYDFYFAGGFGKGPAAGTFLPSLKNLPSVSNVLAIPKGDGFKKDLSNALAFL